MCSGTVFPDPPVKLPTWDCQLAGPCTYFYFYASPTSFGCGQQPPECVSSAPGSECASCHINIKGQVLDVTSQSYQGEAFSSTAGWDERKTDNLLVTCPVWACQRGLHHGACSVQSIATLSDREQNKSRSSFPCALGPCGAGGPNHPPAVTTARECCEVRRALCKLHWPGQQLTAALALMTS